MYRKVIYLIALLILLAPLQPVFGVSSSGSYKIYSGSVVSSGGSATSGSYGAQSDVVSIGVSSGATSNSYAIGGSSFSVTAPAAAAEEDSSVASTEGYSLMQLDVDPPIVLTIDIFNIKSDQAVIKFTTDELAVAYIQYGKLSSYDIQTGSESSFRQNHEFLLGGLEPSQSYSFTVHLRDVVGNISESISYDFVTLPRGTLVLAPTNFRSLVSSNGVLLTWIKPATSAWNNVKIVRSTNYYPQSLSDGQVIYVGSDQSFLDYNIASGQTYYYTIFAFNNDNDSSSGTITLARIGASTKPSQLPDEQNTTNLVNPDVKEVDIEDVLALPDNAEEVASDDTMDIKSIRLFNMVSRNVSEIWSKTEAELEKLASDKKDMLESIVGDIFDTFGRVNKGIIRFLDSSKTKEVEEVIGHELPPLDVKDNVNGVAVLDSSLSEIDDNWHLMTGEQGVVTIPRSAFKKEVNTIIVTLADQAYVLTYDDTTGNYKTTLNAPPEKGEYVMIIQVIYDDNTYERIERTVLIDPYGTIYERQWMKWSLFKPWQFFQKNDVMVEKAVVTLYAETENDTWQVWPAHFYGQDNPQLTMSDGKYSFMVPKGKYYFKVEKEGYKTFTSSKFEAVDKVVNIDVRLDTEKGDWSRVLVLIFIILFFGIIWMVKIKK